MEEPPSPYPNTVNRSHGRTGVPTTYVRNTKIMREERNYSKIINVIIDKNRTEEIIVFNNKTEIKRIN